MSINELNALVKDYRELTVMVDEITAQIDSIKDQIKQYMNDVGKDEIIGIDWKATYKPVTSARLDTTAIKKELPDIYARYSKESTCMRFNLK